MELLVIFGLILLNGCFAMAELALVSAKRVRLEKLAGEGSRGARTAIALADDPSGFLSTVQVGITLISIFNGAFGEASLVDKLTPQLGAVPALRPYAHGLALGVVVAGITLASILFGELIPKRIAIQYPETMATLIARPLHLLSRLMTPFVRFLSGTTNLIVRLLGLRQEDDSVATADDIKGMLRESADAGKVDRTESDIAARALRLDEQRLSAIMTPRVDLHFIDLEDELQGNLATIAASPYSRFPVHRGDPFQVLGVVHAGDLFGQAIRHGAVGGIDIEAALRMPLVVPDSVSPSQLLEQLRNNRAELALVVDEHGQLKGMVTLSDLMAALVGGVAGGDDHNADAVRREDGSWLLDGAMALGRVREVLGLNAAFPGEESGAYHTLAGFVLNQLGHIPAVSDHFDWGGWCFEVMDMDRNRVDRLLVTPRQER